ncbi:MAG TPA: hypothetical protein VF354_05910 [Candidatus Methanoperedens sp.]
MENIKTMKNIKTKNEDINLPDINKSGDDFSNRLALASREERAALLKNGLIGKDIESKYLKTNNIRVIGVNWQDLKP